TLHSPIYPQWAIPDPRAFFGLGKDGGAVIYLPGGTLVKIEPGRTDAVYQAVVKAIEDMLPGLAVRQIAARTGNSPAQQEMERAGFDQILQSALQLLETLGLLKSGGSLTAKE